MTADEIIAALALEPHPEGGHFREIYRAPAGEDERAAVTTIYYLLQAGERSHWHRVDAVEIWNFHAGGPLTLRMSEDGECVTTVTLGDDLKAGHKPQVIVPKDAWQAAEPLSAYTLVGCTVAPAFEFTGFELAPEGWEPGGRARTAR